MEADGIRVLTPVPCAFALLVSVSECVASCVPKAL